MSVLWCENVIVVLRMCCVCVQNLGGKVIKRYLELFTDAMIDGLKSPSRLVATAAGDCVVAMQRMV